MTDKKNEQQIRLTNQDLIAYADHVFAQEKNVSLHAHIDTMVELMADHLECTVDAARRQGKKEVGFLQFWTIKQNKYGEFTATFRSHSAARQLTALFNENGESVTSKMHEYFYQVLTKAPAFLNYINELSSIAKKKKTQDVLYAPKNLIYLYKVIMLSILDLAYRQPDTWITLIPLGQFTRCFRLFRNSHDEKTKGGILQFFPSYL